MTAQEQPTLLGRIEAAIGEHQFDQRGEAVGEIATVACDLVARCVLCVGDPTLRDVFLTRAIDRIAALVLGGIPAGTRQTDEAAVSSIDEAG